ncbi:nicotinate-nucleotide--dimethylbenzimidazole phosphoribosyltransferase [Propionicicella superfundia]|uniref:nicotinate-nucleotide--dimethylbenzimidazole phosphoribosyltransferase n=1 Tax=Propionicicella superfundia TaxID=348582 RepID=UPI00041C9F62|nr:nicotinate-nucleotide--dimethylbenzimidazole phosphoribosyltransferase [Propionicicella superfundia]
MTLSDILAPVDPPAADVYVEAVARSDDQAKPVGALGRLEELAAWISACQGVCPPEPLTEVRAVVFAGDHGVSAHGVSAYPATITPQMLAGIVAGGAGVNALARAAGVHVRAVDIGVAVDLPGLSPDVTAHKIMHGSRPLHIEDALTAEETEAALLAGDAIAAAEIEAGAQLLISGDLGIGNTTPAAALIASTLDVPASKACGRGTGLDEGGLAAKVALVDAALQRVGDVAPLRRLAALGSADMAAAVGFMIGAARRRVPILVDGVIAASEALLAEQLAPGARLWMRAGHRSTEPGITLALDSLGLEPILDLRMRLGEGTGAVLAVPIVRAAVGALREVALLSEITGGHS